jgi:effector-binding domain-containing protein
MITTPKLDVRKAVPFAAIRTQVAIPFGKVLPELWGEVHTWLAGQGITPSGAPFIRYLTTDMSTKLDLEVGWPVASAPEGNRRISTGVLPAGRYAVLTYTGTYKGKGLFHATVALLDWAKENHIVWKKSIVDNVEWWASRVEFYITDPETEPDSKKWQTELAFMVSDSE